MIERTYTFEDSTFVVHVQGADRSGNLWGVLDILTVDMRGHLLPPERISLFDAENWQIVARKAAMRNSGNVDLWYEHGEQVRVALIEDSEVITTLSPQTSQLHSPIYSSEVVKLEVVRLSEQSRPGARQFRVQDLLPEGWPVMLWGDSGHGKSYLAGTLGQCVAKGDKFLGLDTVQGRVLYADWELDLEEQTRRAYEVAKGLGLDTPTPGFDYVRVDYPFVERLPWFKEQIEEHDYKLLILDSFGLACGGDAEVSRYVIPFFLSLRQIPCCVLMIDHQSRLQPGQKYRDKDAFGSIYKKHLSRSAIQVQVIVDDRTKKGLALRHAKANFSARRENTYAWLEFKDGETMLSSATAKEMEDAGASEDMGTNAQIRVALREKGNSTAEAISNETAINLGTVRNELTKMKKTGEIEERDKQGQAIVYALKETHQDE